MHWIITINEDLLLKIEKILSSLFLFFFFAISPMNFLCIMMKLEKLR